MGILDQPGYSRGQAGAKFTSRALIGSALMGLRPCATRTRIVLSRDSAGTSQSDGVRLIRTSMTKHFFPDDAHNIRLIYGNTAWWNTLATNYPITVTAAFKIGGTLYQVTFGGKTSASIDPLGYTTSDPIAPMVSAGTWVELRTSVTVTTGNKFPAALVVSSNGGVAEAYFDDSDQTMVGSPAWNGTTGTAIYGPAAIVGFVPNPARPSVLLDGDSILQGWGDSTVQIPYDAGWGCKAMANQFSYLQASLYGDSAANFTVPWLRDRGKFGGCTDYVISALGSNDFYVNARTATQVQADVISRWRFYADKGSRVIATTITPRTTTTDAYATVANQTVSDVTKNGYRVTYNNWLRDGAPMTSSYLAVAAGTNTAGTLRVGDPSHPLYSYLEIADISESARDSGKWSVSFGQPTTDGTHPSSSMVTGIAAGINLTAAMPKM